MGKTKRFYKILYQKIKIKRNQSLMFFNNSFEIEIPMKIAEKNIAIPGIVNSYAKTNEGTKIVIIEANNIVNRAK